MKETVQIYIVTGSTGAGKTSYSRQLCEGTGAVRFSIDEWMDKLFWMDSPRPIQYEWALERIGRCEEMIFGMVLDLARVGISSVLDLGFTKAEHRAKFFNLVKVASLPYQLHWVDVAPDIRWQRVIRRNQQRGKTFVMEVNREMFDFMDSIWEPPSCAELEEANGVHFKQQ
ncbi:ATP-binding protein [Pseudomonas sp.]|uniref:AAA family ATPase n=1 Tax=Pseudomonas sp. TaxID=306 RepID=UPI0026352366|nr:ATP-binding protein [Pseudomonas sp.]